MADLQDELHPTTEVGELPLEEPFPEVPYACDPLERAREILAEHPVVDGYGTLPWALRGLPWYDLELGESAVDTDVPRLREGHVGAVLWALHLPEGAGSAVSVTLEQLDLVRTVVAAHPEGLRPARTAGQVIDARNCGRVAVLLGPAGAPALDDSLAVLRVLHTLGLRVLTLAGTSWASEAGLSRFGDEVVREMNRLGVIADLSGASDATIVRALALSKAPVLCTRSAARALRPHPDNLSDELLSALGRAKGVCMVPLTADQTGPTLTDVADHLDHIRAVAGPASVALSGAYDSPSAHPESLPDPSAYPHLITELLRRGWPDTDIALLTWDNFQRVLRGADFLSRTAQHRREQPPARAVGVEG
ncbi:dipeptidase [Streptomyces acidiscabies]|uniref:Dipeptidase n=1 Tax=Streptomyces acidiscabies TaxID=42234 RepID=A0AAP6BHU2_9ACTN|nr:dipeptidase [Streptomyces acidiscabies]MBP5939202.1 membrane dipeptidase [Streptomyces sp. LBUM 1476]MBZ3910322.1 dipeptidase [Streptomyces acidiscabies]MDX2964996.1 dipeptidase [Streptomyces acidiscabies]MDX3024677.1 dipeptidase [Streptomyces acidiscabies]MDX3796008.1 dipeptidase [Streptomyces acidiscabies]